MKTAKFLKTGEFCELLGIAPVTARKWRALGYGPRWVKIGGQCKYPLRETVAWLQAQPGGGGDTAQK